MLRAALLRPGGARQRVVAMAGPPAAVAAPASSAAGETLVATARGGAAAAGPVLAGSVLPPGAAVVVDAGSAPAAAASSFGAARFLEALATRRCGHLVLAAAELASTQTFLQRARGLPHGTLCLADRQTTGKGRGGNEWSSPEGCLMFSLLHETRMDGAKLPFMQYVISLALVKAAEALVGDVGLRIKWPNDLYAEGAKVGGVLCTSTFREGAFHVVVGAGLNVTNSEPTTCLADLSRRRGGAGTVDRELLLARTLERFEAHVDTLEAEGFGPLRAAYLARWLHTGQAVHFDAGHEGAGEAGGGTLVVDGLAESGFLLARDEAGALFELHPDGNRLDFWTGLIRRRL